MLLLILVCGYSVFPYVQGAEDLAEVIEADYEACDGRRPLSRWIAGNATVKLQSAGRKYFVSSFPGHCPPLKLAITVLDPTMNHTTDSSVDKGMTITALRSVPAASASTGVKKNQAPSVKPSDLTWALFGTAVLLFSLAP
jgi:hypothetical protein